MGANTTRYPGSRPPRRGKRLSERSWGNFAGWRLVLMATAIVAVVIGAGFMAVRGLEDGIILEVDGKPEKLYTFKDTVGDALAEFGVNVGEKDLVEPGLDESVSDGMTIKVVHAVPIRIVADGREIEIVTIPSKVEEILAKAGVALGPIDRTEPARDAVVDPASPIRVVRIEEKEMEVNQEIPFRVEKKDDANLEKGIRRVVSRGVNGLERQRVKILYENGQEVKREVLAQETVREPKAQVVAYGTIDQVSRGGVNFRFKEALIAESTAYTYTGRNTASGAPPRVGIVAVDPGVIPLGSRLYVEGYGFATAADRGGAIRGNRIDVFLESEQDCRKWGRRSVKVYIIE